MARLPSEDFLPASAQVPISIPSRSQRRSETWSHRPTGRGDPNIIIARSKPGCENLGYEGIGEIGDQVPV